MTLCRTLTGTRMIHLKDLTAPEKKSCLMVIRLLAFIDGPL